MNILLAVEDLRVGGAQIFTLRLGQALSQHHQVYVYNHYWDLVYQPMIDQLAPDVQVVTCKLKFDRWLKKFDRLLYFFSIPFSSREFIIGRHVKLKIKELDIALVHSNMYKSDIVMVDGLREFDVPIVITTHGDYELFLERFVSNRQEYIHKFNNKVKRILKRIKGIAYLSDKNLAFIKSPVTNSDHADKNLIIRKIYNGFAGNFTKDSEISRARINIPDDAMVFGMVARGIEEKGWLQAIEGFNRFFEVTQTGYLVLVGDSPYLRSLQERFKACSNIIFTGYSDNSIDWIRLFDVGLLPSYFDAESLPNSVTEYLFCCKPVIASAVAEIKNMITTDGKQAGYTIDLVNNKVPSEAIFELMLQYFRQPDLLKLHKEFAGDAFEKFSIDKCVASYLQLYSDVMNKKPL